MSVYPVIRIDEKTDQDNFLPPEPEKTEFEVILEKVPAEKKVAVVKVIQILTGLGLKEAKDLVESTPQVVQSAIALSLAEDVKQQLKAVGAVVSLN